MDCSSEPSDFAAIREGWIITSKEWHDAVTAWASGEEAEVGLLALLAGLDEQDEHTVRAFVVAAEERFGPSWVIGEFFSVVDSFAASYGNGWAGLAEDYLEDHYPGFPTAWLKDLDAIGRDVKRDSEQYLLLDGVLYVFDRREGSARDGQQ